MFLNIVSCIGITIIVTQSSIFEDARNAFSSIGDFFDELIHCPMCFGFWVGLILGFVYGKDVVMTGPISSILSWIVYTIANFLYSITIYFQNNSDIEED